MFICIVLHGNYRIELVIFVKKEQMGNHTIVPMHVVPTRLCTHTFWPT